MGSTSTLKSGREGAAAVQATPGKNVQPMDKSKVQMDIAGKQSPARNSERLQSRLEAAGTRRSPVSDRTGQRVAAEEEMSTDEVKARPVLELMDIDNNQAKDEFDISSMPASRLLNPKEKKLCTQLRLKPSQYISIKTLMLKVRKLSFSSPFNLLLTVSVCVTVL